jgi:3-oxoacyl-[acyl-carrier-protein] synthase II
MTAISSTFVSKPFDETRDGFIQGEGAAIFVLERLDLALARGATILGEIVGAASNADAYHITAPSPGGVGATRCMQLALEDAGLEPSDIKQINAHGTSTPLNDKAESQAIAAVFGNDGPPVVSIKGVTGHPLGAAGALELAAVMLSFEKKLIPPTRGTTVVDPEMSIDVVIGEPRPWEPGPTISNNFGFGGHNGSVIVSPYVN